MSVVFLIIFRCAPISMNWDISATGHCNGNQPQMIGSGAVNVFSDLLILALPLWAIWHLRMRTKNKVGVYAVFACGLLYVSSPLLRDSVCALLIFRNTQCVYLEHWSSRIHNTAVPQWRYHLCCCKDYHVDVSEIPKAISSHADWFILIHRLAEVSSIILCTCLPLMPRFVKTVKDKISGTRSTITGSPSTYSHMTDLRNTGPTDDKSSSETTDMDPSLLMGTSWIGDACSFSVNSTCVPYEEGRVSNEREMSRGIQVTTEFEVTDQRYRQGIV